MASSLVVDRPTRRRTSTECRNDLTVQNMPLVKYVFGRMSLYCPNHLSREDLTSSGVIGLMKAAQEYDPSNQTRFSTFAIPRIRGSILDELRTHDWIPRSVKRKMASLGQARTKLEGRLDGALSEKHLARNLQLSQRQLHKMLALTTPVTFVPLDNAPAQTDRDETVPLAETVKHPRSESPLALLAAEEDRHRLGQAILELADPDRLIITLHYYKGMMLKDIARVLKLSKSRISQIHKQALERLRDKLQEVEPAEAV